VPSERRARSSRTPWLTLGETASLLGVSEATVRRWADGGQLASFVTPGGHRRFPRAVVESLIPGSRASRAKSDGGFSEEAITAAYRRRGGTGLGKLPPWIADLSEVERSEFRERGRALVQLLLEHLESVNRRQGEIRLEAAEGIAREYGRRAVALGASLSETVQGFLFFRAPFVGEIARQAAGRGLDTRQATTMLVKAEAAMDRLLRSVLESFSELSQ
jgi:excisionase family DNA binding protein